MATCIGVGSNTHPTTRTQLLDGFSVPGRNGHLAVSTRCGLHIADATQWCEDISSEFTRLIEERSGQVSANTMLRKSRQLS